MNKNEMINEIMSSMVFVLNKEQMEFLKMTYIVKMQGYEIHELCTLPSTEVKDNEYIFKRFTVDMLAKGLTESSIKCYMHLIRPFFDMVGKNYREVTSQDVIDYLAIRKLKPNAKGKMNSQTYIVNISRVLFVFFDWAYRKHHIEVDIMRDVDRMRNKQKKKDRISMEEVEACRDHVRDEREKALLELMLSTGMRVGEIAALKIEDIDFPNRKVHIREGKTVNAERDVYLTIKARNALKRYLKDRWCGYVFRPYKHSIPNDAPMNKGTIQKIAKEIGERANCHCITTVHIYRKTFASEEYKRTSDVKYVSILLGHSSTAITEKYYLIDDMKAVEYQALYA